MITIGRNTGKAMSIPKGIGISGIISLGTTVLMSVILAKLLDHQLLTWEQVGYWIMVMLFTSAFWGAKAAIVAIRSQRMAVSIMAGSLYWGALLCITALFFGGNYDGVMETALIIIAGSGCAAIVSLPQKKQKGRVRGKR